jgi:hypothetical protein
MSSRVHVVRRGAQFLADVVDGRPVWTGQAALALYWASVKEAMAVLDESAQGWASAWVASVRGKPVVLRIVGLTRRPRLIGPPTLRTINSLLGLVVDHSVAEEVIAQWSFVERAHAMRWAAQAHMRASDNIVRMLPEPECVRFARAEQGRAVQRVEAARAVLASGTTDESTVRLARLVLNPPKFTEGHHA